MTRIFIISEFYDKREYLVVYKAELNDFRKSEVSFERNSVCNVIKQDLSEYRIACLSAHQLAFPHFGIFSAKNIITLDFTCIRR